MRDQSDLYSEEDVDLLGSIVLLCCEKDTRLVSTRIVQIQNAQTYPDIFALRCS